MGVAFSLPALGANESGVQLQFGGESSGEAPVVASLQRLVSGNWQEVTSGLVVGGGSFFLDAPELAAGSQLKLVVRSNSAKFVNVSNMDYKVVTKAVQTYMALSCDTDAVWNDGYRYGFNGQVRDDQIRELGNSYEFKYRGYDARLGRFISRDPLAAQYPWNSTYAFAENDVIRAMDLEGREKLIVNQVSEKDKTATLTIVKDIEILKNNLPEKYLNMNLDQINKNFTRGNTILYMSSLPENGKHTSLKDRKDWRKGNAYKVEVVYNINAIFVDNPNVSYDDDGGRVSSVSMKKTPFKKEEVLTPEVGGRAAAGGSDRMGADKQVALNSGFGGGLSPEDVITHEVGIHNMGKILHKMGPDGNAIYPEGAGLEGNTPGQIYPTESDTINFIDINIQRGRVTTVK